jgi:hypothetical protein
MCAEMFLAGYDSVDLKKYLGYMEKVLDNVWREAHEELDIGVDWRSPTLDDWMAKEFFVGRHSDSQMEAWLAQNTLPSSISSSWDEVESFLCGRFPGQEVIRHKEYMWGKLGADDKAAIYEEMERWVQLEGVLNNNNNNNNSKYSTFILLIFMWLRLELSDEDVVDNRSQSAESKSNPSKLAMSKHAVLKPTSLRPTKSKPATSKHARSKAATLKHATSKAVTSRPSNSKPSDSGPTASKQSTSKSSMSNPGDDMSTLSDWSSIPIPIPAPSEESMNTLSSAEEVSTDSGGDGGKCFPYSIFCFLRQ